MKLPHIVILFVLAIIPFAFSIWRVSVVRESTLRKTVEQKSTPDQVEPSLSPSQKASLTQEERVQYVLLRGVIQQVNLPSNQLVIAKEENPRADNPVTLDVTVDISKLNDIVKCWPEQLATNTGATISVKTAYLPLSPDTDLYLKGQTFNSLSSLDKDLVGKYALIKYQPNYDKTAIEATQMAVLGCSI